jgi:hypothetical protein
MNIQLTNTFQRTQYIRKSKFTCTCKHETDKFTEHNDIHGVCNGSSVGYLAWYITTRPLNEV